MTLCSTSELSLACCSPDVSLRLRGSFLYQTTADGGAVVPDQRLYVFRYIPINPAATGPAFQYITEHWDTLIDSSVRLLDSSRLTNPITAHRCAPRAVRCESPASMT